MKGDTHARRLPIDVRNCGFALNTPFCPRPGFQKRLCQTSIRPTGGPSTHGQTSPNCARKDSHYASVVICTKKKHKHLSQLSLLVSLFVVLESVHLVISRAVCCKICLPNAALGSWGRAWSAYELPPAAYALLVKAVLQLLRLWRLGRNSLDLHGSYVC
jgi:hypothetical protein